MITIFDNYVTLSAAERSRRVLVMNLDFNQGSFRLRSAALKLTVVESGGSALKLTFVIKFLKTAYTTE